MGGYCCSGQTPGGVHELKTAMYPHGQTLGGVHYSENQIAIIVRIQSGIRMFLAKRRCQRLRNATYMPGMHQMDGIADG